MLRERLRHLRRGGNAAKASIIIGHRPTPLEDPAASSTSGTCRVQARPTPSYYAEKTGQGTSCFYAANCSSDHAPSRYEWIGNFIRKVFSGVNYVTPLLNFNFNTCPP